MENYPKCQTMTEDCTHHTLFISYVSAFVRQQS